MKHIHNPIFLYESVVGATCCFSPSDPCKHCGNCITGAGCHDFDPSEPDGKYVIYYRCSICGEILKVEK